jgi:superfamily I DNA/RNA helicase
MRKSVRIKDDLHALIDKIDNNELLEVVYQLLDSRNRNTEGELINSLSEQQKKELYESYDESLDESNLIDLDKLRTKHSKWFEK